MLFEQCVADPLLAGDANFTARYKVPYVVNFVAQAVAVKAAPHLRLLAYQDKHVEHCVNLPVPVFHLPVTDRHGQAVPGPAPPSNNLLNTLFKRRSGQPTGKLCQQS